MKINTSGLARIFAKLFAAPKAPAKDWGAKFGYAPANRWELGEWNASLTDRHARRRDEREQNRELRAKHKARIAGYVASGRYEDAVYFRQLGRNTWNGGL